MSIAKIANGTLLKVGDAVTPTEGFTTVPEVMRYRGPSVRFDLLDVTSHDSSGFFKEFIPGLADGESISATINWRPSNAVHKSLRIDSYASTKRNFKAVFPDTTDNTVLVSTYVTKIEPRADIGKPLEADIEIKITGAPAWS